MIPIVLAYVNSTVRALDLVIHDRLVIDTTFVLFSTAALLATVINAR